MEQHTRKKGLTRVLATSLDKQGGMFPDDNVVTTLTLASIFDRQAAQGNDGRDRPPQSIDSSDSSKSSQAGSGNA